MLRSVSSSCRTAGFSYVAPNMCGNCLGRLALCNKGIDDYLLGGATCTIFGATIQPVGDGDAVLVLHLMLMQSIIWPNAHCAPAGFLSTFPQQRLLGQLH